VTRSSVKSVPEGLHAITPHIVVRDAAQAAEWYKQAFGARERSRVPLPGGKLMSVELWFGDSAVMVADEFPELDVVSPQTVGGTSTVLHLYTEDVDATAGASPSTCGTSRTSRSCAQQPRRESASTPVRAGGR
jgi:PhnB protein